MQSLVIMEASDSAWLHVQLYRRIVPVLNEKSSGVEQENIFYLPTTSKNSEKESAGMSSSWKALNILSEASYMGMSLCRTYSASEYDQPPSVLLVGTFCNGGKL